MRPDGPRPTVRDATIPDVGFRHRFPVLSLVVWVDVALLVVYVGTCVAAAVFGGYPLDCVGHSTGFLTGLLVLVAPLAWMLDCVRSRVRSGRWPWDPRAAIDS
jgi:hypothetical protein